MMALISVLAMESIRRLIVKRHHAAVTIVRCELLFNGGSTAKGLERLDAAGCRKITQCRQFKVMPRTS